MADIQCICMLVYPFNFCQNYLFFNLFNKVLTFSRIAQLTPNLRQTLVFNVLV